MSGHASSAFHGACQNRKVCVILSKKEGRKRLVWRVEIGKEGGRHQQLNGGLVEVTTSEGRHVTGPLNTSTRAVEEP